MNGQPERARYLVAGRSLAGTPHAYYFFESFFFAEGKELIQFWQIESEEKIEWESSWITSTASRGSAS
jgi:hypothetical protein